MIGIAGGLQERTREDNVSIGTSSSIIAPPRTTTPERVSIVIRNVSSNVADVISLAFGDNKQAEANKGIVLKQNESFVDANSEGYKAFQGQISAICATANGSLAIFER